ncbi:MAG: plasmid pRiA4b ORF-3 family protein [Actinobacteria bacterium]|nr:plasmid pRiA4b ORF-3 family protein [Actinomycetota bacterium]
MFAAARSHTFLQLADAIDTAFARWDRAHLSLFELADATDVCGPIEWDDPPDESVFAASTRLSRLNAGEQFLYTFDMGDDWTHLCTSPSSASTRSRRSASSPTGPWRTRGGARSPTSTAGAAKPTTARPRCHPTRSSPTCRRCARGG